MAAGISKIHQSRELVVRAAIPSIHHFDLNVVAASQMFTHRTFNAVVLHDFNSFNSIFVPKRSALISLSSNVGFVQHYWHVEAVARPRPRLRRRVKSPT
jgi:hypothetical protein